MRIPRQQTVANAAPEPQTRRRVRDSGAAAVELVVVLPVLILILLGAVDFGRFAYSYIALTNAVRAGAGFGANNPPTDATLANWQAQVTQVVKDEMAPLAPTVQPPVRSPADTDQQRTVTVTADYTFTTLIAWPGIPRNVPLHAQTVMRILQ